MRWIISIIITILLFYIYKNFYKQDNQEETSPEITNNIYNFSLYGKVNNGYYKIFADTASIINTQYKLDNFYGEYTMPSGKIINLKTESALLNNKLLDVYNSNVCFDKYKIHADFIRLDTKKFNGIIKDNIKIQSGENSSFNMQKCEISSNNINCYGGIKGTIDITDFQ